jgi:hypothetical protein
MGAGVTRRFEVGSRNQETKKPTSRAQSASWFLGAGLKRIRDGAKLSTYQLLNRMGAQ